MKKVWSTPRLRSLQVNGTSSGTQNYANESSALTALVKECENTVTVQLDNGNFPPYGQSTVCPNPEAYVEAFKPYFLAS